MTYRRLSVIHEADYDDNWKLPVIVVLLGEDGDLIQLDTYDAASDDALATITEHSPDRVLKSLGNLMHEGDPGA